MDAQLDGAQHGWMFQNLAARNNPLQNQEEKTLPPAVSLQHPLLAQFNIVLACKEEIGIASTNADKKGRFGTKR